MRPLLYIGLILGMTVPLVAFGSTQIFMTRTSGTGITATTQMVLNASVNTNSAATSTAGSIRPGTISNLYAYVLKPPTAGTTWTATVMQEGVATAVTCTISSGSPTNAAGAAYCSDTTHSVTTTVDAAITVQIVPTSAPPKSGAYASIQFSPTTANENSIPWTTNGSNITSVAQTYLTPERQRTGNTGAQNVQTYFPESTTIKNLHLVTNASPSPGTYTFTFTKNFINDALTCAISSTGCDDNVNSVTYSNGDFGNFTDVPASSPASTPAGGHVVVVPATTGAFDTFWANIGDFPNTTAGYYGPTTGLNTNEASSSVYTDQFCVTAFTATTSVAVGGGNTRTFALRQGVNGGAMSSTVATCSISGAAGAGPGIYSCMWTGQVQYAQGDLIDVIDTPTGTAPAGNPNILFESLPGVCPVTPVNSLYYFFLQLVGGFWWL